MKFYGRTSEIKALRDIRARASRNAQFTIVTGRRRIGKTELIDQALNDGTQDYVYLLITKQLEKPLCTALQEEVARALGNKVNMMGTAERLIDIVRTVFQASVDSPLTLVIDEFQEIDKIVEHYNKRPDFFAGDKLDYLDMDKGIISDSVGLYRAYRNPQLIRTVKDGILTFYAVGKKDKIEELLSLMIGVGKKTAMGFGIVDRWDVEEIEEDYTTEHPKYGLMRPIEVEKADKTYDYPIMDYAIRPPYWKTINQRLCYVPVG